jgi:predicted nuclease of restriction endonuclease-like (RecB) superfamily
MQQSLPENYPILIEELRENILSRKHSAARLVNREQLLCYYFVGKKLQERISAAAWGDNILSLISNDLQNALPGLRGFSPANLKKMRQFYETYVDLDSHLIGSAVPNQLEPVVSVTVPTLPELNMPAFLDAFLSIGFTHHFALLKIKDPAERWFYMQQSIRNQWSYRVLESQIASDLYNRRGGLPNNFTETLPPDLKNHALEAFKDEYLLQFIDIVPNSERDLERSIVDNIKEFILGLGTGFIFIGNQFRLIVDDQESFIDLLFFSRPLQALVAFELKMDKFQPHYAGQLNYYLTVLDVKHKLPHENPSIGIILCKEKSNTVVEYAFKGISNPMGVATYQFTSKLPEEMKGVLPTPEDLAKLL